jgi:hypothetical protein
LQAKHVLKIAHFMKSIPILRRPDGTVNWDCSMLLSHHKLSQFHFPNKFLSTPNVDTAKSFMLCKILCYDGGD